ncbi:MAG: ABC transporter permease [Planctomycetota bacterium]|jgi:phospholipid/cholesterol/gamma-HCH transport system permease protein|nr:ABC transporter permease [Planctomycetota bacterium]MDP6518416.1 ABC transporter permease [Planctomycetota bacterium]MDP6837435.1 ABC transporter permease [Planctomycetota bacterium]MDP6956191.1 ABC transporter permease [Planctomycetota bacterium]
MIPTRLIVAFFRDWGFRLDLYLKVNARLGDIPRRWQWITEQLYQSGIGVLHVILLVGTFIGMIAALQAGIALSTVGQQDQIGTFVALGLAREMAPFITAIILAATVGSAYAAELGTMAVSEELEALEVMSIDPLRLLVLPRLVALLVMCPVLTIICNIVGVLGGGFVAQAQYHVSFDLYMELALEALRATGTWIPLPKDIFAGLFKAFVFGAIVTVISCSCGLRTHGGALGVGTATRRAVRDSIIAIIISNYFMTWIIYR